MRVINDSDSIFLKPYQDSRHERILHAVANLLCRFGCHNWDKWYTSVYTQEVRRSCHHCTASQLQYDDDPIGF